MVEPGPFKLSFWPALQLRHFFDTLPDPVRFVRPLTKFEEYCSEEGVISQVLSKIYSLLNCPAVPLHLPFLDKWEQDLQRKFTPTQIQHILRFALKSSVCTKIQESNYKILTRWYLTPHLLHLYYSDTTDRCC